MQTLRLFSLLCLSALIMSNSCTRSSAEQVAEQGIKGQVFWMEGNMMPGPGREPAKDKPVVREILIYPLTHTSKATSSPSSEVLFSSLGSQVIQSVQSNEDGSFMIRLPVGKYSVLTKEEDGLFASEYDGEGNLKPIEVKKGEFTETIIRINYAASY